MAESEEELKSLLMKVKEESKKADLNSTFKKLRSWYLVPSLSWQTDGKTMETVTGFIFWTPKSPWVLTAALKLKDTCSLEDMLLQT